MESWGVARVKGGKELAFREWAKERVIIYMPVGHQKRAMRGRIVIQPVPVFPGYVFVEHIPGLVKQLSQTNIFLWMLRDPLGVIMHVRATVIEDLKVREAANEFECAAPATMHSEFVIGSTAVIKNGPLTGFSGTVLGTINHFVLLDVKGRAVKIHTHQCAVYTGTTIT